MIKKLNRRPPAIAMSDKDLRVAQFGLLLAQFWESTSMGDFSLITEHERRRTKTQRRQCIKEFKALMIKIRLGVFGDM